MGWTNPLPITTFVIPSNATTGARIVLNGVTGDIEVYNSANDLVGQWGGPAGQLTSWDGGGGPSGSGPFARFNGRILEFGDTTVSVSSDPNVNGFVGAGGTGLILNSGFSAVTNDEAELFLQDGTAGQATVIARDRGVDGLLVKTNSTSTAVPSKIVCGFLPAGATTDANGLYKLPMAGLVNGMTVSGAVMQYDQSHHARGPYVSGLFYDQLPTFLGSQWLNGSAVYASSAVFASYIIFGT